MRWTSFRLVALAGVAVLFVLFVVLRPLGHDLIVKAYFANGMGLRAGAPVRLAGVDIGHVKSLRAHPDVKEAPVEVLMVLNPSYELKIPNDSTVTLETAGVLGETFVEIDAASASGAPIGASAVLKAKPAAQLPTERILQVLSEVMGKKDCACDTKRDDAPSVTAKKSLSKSPPQ